MYFFASALNQQHQAGMRLQDTLNTFLKKSRVPAIALYRGKPGACFWLHESCNISEPDPFPFIIEPAPSCHAMKIADILDFLKRQEFIVCQPDGIFNKPFGAKIPCSPVEFRTFPKCRIGKSVVRRWWGGSRCMILTCLLQAMPDINLIYLSLSETLLRNES